MSKIKFVKKKRQNPGMEDLLEVGKATGMSKNKLKSIADEIKEIVMAELDEYL